MIPKDIINIIDNYNETGIFVEYNGGIYWFNGTRFEYWCPLQDENILTYENDLYYLANFKVFKYKNKDSIKVKVPKIWNHPLYLFSEWYGYVSQVIYQNKVYRHRYNSIIEMFDGKDVIRLPSKIEAACGVQILIYNQHIYSFGTQNEKFDFKTQQWIKLKTSNCYGHVYLFNNKLYRMERYDTTYYTYNVEFDTWE